MSTNVHSDLALVKQLVYDTCNFECTDPKADVESADYAACTYRINGKHVIYRAAKVTPTKVGLFVTLWKRKGNGPIEPYEISDNLDFVVISTRTKKNFGQFIFPKSILLEKGILTGNNKEGKRGFRVYPPWDNVSSNQALKTQQWQAGYFLNIQDSNSANLALAKKLYTSK